jgi:cysteine-rich repeat protein
MRCMLFLLGLGLVACGPPAVGGSSSSVSCSSDDDCRSDFVCTNRRCKRGTRIPGADAGVPADGGSTEPEDGGVSVPDAGIAPANCGDGMVQEDAGELCDDGNDIDTDACTNRCRPAGCGDGSVWEGNEECDDGNRDHFDGCLNTCLVARCGDGVQRRDVQEGMPGFEACDDGNRSAGDGCDAGCQLEEGASCGNGRLEDGEECDDGNNQDGDGCSSSCQEEEPDDLDVPDTPEEASRIRPPVTLEGSIGRQDDRDYFRFFATRTGIYSLVTEGRTSLVCSIELEGNPVARDETGNNCNIRTRLTGGRTYHLRISGAARSMGPYSFTLQFVE